MAETGAGLSARELEAVSDELRLREPGALLPLAGLRLLSTLVCYTFSGVRAGLERLFPNPYLRVVAGSAVVMLLTALLGTKAYLGSGAAMIQQALEQGSAQPWDFGGSSCSPPSPWGRGSRGARSSPPLPLGPALLRGGALLGLPAPYAAGIGMVACSAG